jgi:hypothetical protein
MKTIQQILAVLSAIVLLAGSVFTAHLSSKFRPIFSELGTDSVTPLAQFFFSTPFWATILAGGCLACGVGYTIWRLNRSWIAIPASLLIAALVFVYPGLYAMALLESVSGLMRQTDNTESSDPTHAPYASPVEGSTH